MSIDMVDDWSDLERWEKREGLLVFVRTTKTLAICVDGQWVEC
jgi:hypothetical protein